MRRFVSLLTLAAVLAGCGGSSSGGTGGSSPSTLNLATAELKQSDLPSGYILAGTRLVQTYTGNMTLPNSQLNCSTPQSLTTSAWKQGLIEGAEGLQQGNLFQECGYLVNGNGDPEALYQDVKAAAISSFMQEVSEPTIGDESAVATYKNTSQIRGQLFALVFRRGNAVIALLHGVAVGRSPLNIGQFTQLGQTLNRRLR